MENSDIPFRKRIKREKNNMKQNVILIGMPGVGKSTAGVVLAKMMGYHFVDSDLVIQQQTGLLLKEIIEQRGTQGLLDVENRVNATLDADRSVIATGGSVIYGSEAMDHLKSIGTVVYLHASYKTIKSRLSNLAGRGVAMRENQTLHELYLERCVLYEKYADIKVDIDHMKIEEAVCKILQCLR